MNIKKILLEELENGIIQNNIYLVKEPNLENHKYGAFINAGKVITLNTLGYIQDGFEYTQYMKLAKGFYKDKIFEDYAKADAKTILTLSKYLEEK